MTFSVVLATTRNVVLGAAGILRQPDAGRRAGAIRASKIVRDGHKRGDDLLRDDRFRGAAKRAALGGRDLLQAFFTWDERRALRRLRVRRKHGLRGIRLHVRQNDAAPVLTFQQRANGSNEGRVLMQQTLVARGIGGARELEVSENLRNTRDLAAAGVRRCLLLQPEIRAAGYAP